MTKITDLNELLVDELRDILSAEKQLVKALPKMAKGAASPELQAAFSEHLEVTMTHVTRVQKALAALGQADRAKHCKGMEGLIEEGSEMLEADAEGPIKDTGLIGAAQRVEHYEIAAYGTVCALADKLGMEKVSTLLRQSLEEEKEADQKLTQIAESMTGEGELPDSDEADDSDDQDSDDSESKAPKGGSKSGKTAPRTKRS